jgi:hypothetical protein
MGRIDSSGSRPRLYHVAALRLNAYAALRLEATKKRLVPQGHQPFRFYRLDHPFRCHRFALLLGQLATLRIQLRNRRL